MQLFIDTADTEKISQAYDWGLISGVTTNPTSVAAANKNYPDVLREILDIIDEGSTLSAEVLATDAEEMIEEGLALAELDERMVIKIPCTWDGIKAAHVLAMEEVLVNMTLVFSVNQALLAAKARAFYVSVFVGRLNDREEELGYDRIEEIVDMYETQGLDSQILYASVRSTADVEQAALAGADIATVKPEILENLVKHELTDAGLERFLADAKSAGIKI